MSVSDRSDILRVRLELIQTAPYKCSKHGSANCATNGVFLVVSWPTAVVMYVLQFPNDLANTTDLPEILCTLQWQMHWFCQGGRNGHRHLKNIRYNDASLTRCLGLFHG